jgi:hypothetical protein
MESNKRRWIEMSSSAAAVQIPEAEPGAGSVPGSAAKPDFHTRLLLKRGRSVKVALTLKPSPEDAAEADPRVAFFRSVVSLMIKQMQTKEK